MKKIYLILAALMMALPQIAVSQAVDYVNRPVLPLQAGTEDCEVPESCSADQEDTLASRRPPFLREQCANTFANGQATGYTSTASGCAVQATQVPASGPGKTSK